MRIESLLTADTARRSCNWLLRTVAFCLATATWMGSPCWAGDAAQDAATGSGPVPIVVSARAAPAERIAAEELADYLSKLYPAERFAITTDEPRNDRAIRLGTPKSAPQLVGHLGGKDLAGAESYVVTSATIDGRATGVICGADPAGVIYGVCGLLEELGCGFYLSFETLPEPRNGKLDFRQWDLADRPLVPARFVLNWHNFLSGCSTWNLQHWNLWTARLQKMGYNAVMVHAYGNNPMAGFRFQGTHKPVGYLSSTRVGRDWSTNHVNDVRRLFGGHVFDGPVFGADASIEGTDRQRTEAAQRLMHDVFAHAERRGVNVYFALDVDTASANPQELISMLPERARFAIQPRAFARAVQAGDKVWLPNPDVPEGYRYYKAQLAALLKAYPQLDVLVLWFRTQNTPWMGLKTAEMPPDWQRQYQAAVEKSPQVGRMWRSPGLFGIGKIAQAARQALKELGREDVELGMGSWVFAFLPASDRFAPPGVGLFPLDYEVLVDRSKLGTAERRAEIAAVGKNRPVWPIVWAHHDDGQYIGPPYRPPADFHQKLTDAAAAGYGVIHWLNRPLDLYFKSLSRQVFSRSRNEPLKATCRRMAGRIFGPDHADRLGEYLYRWITEAPKIGRETRDTFIDHELPDPQQVAAAAGQRMALLESIDAASVSPAVKARLGYFRGLERYLLDVHRCESLYRRALAQLKAGDAAAARQTIAQARPEEVIRRFARFNQLIGTTRGDEGLVVSMNTRWLTHYVRLRQRLGTEPIRYNFAPTSHDPLAQLPGKFTFHFGPDRSIWQSYGRRETGAEHWALAEEVQVASAAGVSGAHAEICRSGIQSEKPITIRVQPIMRDVVDGRWPGGSLPAGDYRLCLLMLDPAAAGEHVFDVKVTVRNGHVKGTVAGPDRQVTDRIDLPDRAGGRNRPCKLDYALTLDTPGEVTVTLQPIRGTARISGLVLEPVSARKREKVSGTGKRCQEPFCDLKPGKTPRFTKPYTKPASQIPLEPCAKTALDTLIPYGSDPGEHSKVASQVCMERPWLANRRPASEPRDWYARSWMTLLAADFSAV